MHLSSPSQFVEHLLQGQPVVWKTIGEVFRTRVGTTPQKSNPDLWEGGTIPWFRIEDLRLQGTILDDALQHVTPLSLNGSGPLKPGTILLVTGGTIGMHAMLTRESLCNQQLTNFEIREHLRDVLDHKFVFYYFFVIDEWCKQNAQQKSFPIVHVSAIKKVLFPIPPLDVQQRIVEILDSYTAVEDEIQEKLAAEIKLSRQQYEFYRHQLLDFQQDARKDTVIWMKLSEVCKVAGRIGFLGYRKKDLVKKHAGAISVSPANIRNEKLDLSPEISTYISWEKYEESPGIMLEEGDVLLSKIASIGKVALVKSLREKATINPQMVVFKNISCLPAYLSYYMMDDVFQANLRALCGRSSVPNISQTKLKSILIPIPPLAEQQRIVDILDQLDSRTTSIMNELSRESTLRRKQYEYYRSQLLNFS